MFAPRIEVTHLALKALGVVVSAERPQPRRRLLPLLRHDRLLAKAALGRLLPVVVLCAVNLKNNQNYDILTMLGFRTHSHRYAGKDKG